MALTLMGLMKNVFEVGCRLHRQNSNNYSTVQAVPTYMAVPQRYCGTVILYCILYTGVLLYRARSMMKQFYSFSKFNYSHALTTPNYCTSINGQPYKGLVTVQCIVLWHTQKRQSHSTCTTRFMSFSDWSVCENHSELNCNVLYCTLHNIP